VSAVQDANALDVLRRDIPGAAIGFVLLALGIGAAILAWTRRRARDPTLLYFSVFCSLYGARLLCDLDATEILFRLPRNWDKLINVLNYLILVPAFLFFERVMGAGWRSSVLRLWQIAAVFAAVAIPVEIASPSPGPLLLPYHLLVIAALLVASANLFAPGQERNAELRLLRASFLVLAVFVLVENLRALGLTPWRLNVEPVGFLFFISGLGAISARRVFAAQERLSAIRQELETARRIQAATLPQEPPQTAGLEVAARYLPASEVAGDFYDFLSDEGRRLGIFVADVSGHGVPAALVASMLKVAVAAQSAHAASPARVLSEIHQIFHGKLRNQFITALYVDLEPAAGRLTWASAGHPPPLLWRRGDARVDELAHNGAIIGRFRRTTYTEASMAIGPGDRLLLFTDGIPEARSPAGEPFGDDRLRSFLTDHASRPAERIAEALIARIAEWTGRSAGFEDDLTLVVVGIEGKGLRGPSPV
jgi:phosphoserine phosphatase RsbU/P